MSAQGWSVKGIDPKVREAAREAAARQGMSLSEYLNQALSGAAPSTPTGQQPTPPRGRAFRYADASASEQEGNDWQVGDSRSADPARLAQKIESIERRMQLAVTGLDRAVSTIDRSVLGLSARIDDAEAMSSEAAERLAQAMEQFRLAGQTLSGRLDHTDAARERLEGQVAAANEIARRAEAAAAYLSAELENKDAEVAQTLSEARAVAEEAAHQAGAASADAVRELHALQEQLSSRLAESEQSMRRAIEGAVADVREESAIETRGTREALLEEVVRLEGEIAKRVGNVDQLKADQAALIARIERAEANAREATAGLRQAAGAAIADLRNTQLTLASRVKQVEDVAGGGDLTDIRHAQQDIAERLRALEVRTDANPVADALAAFEARVAHIETSTVKPAKIEAVDSALQRLAERLAETESTANTAIRTLEETVSSLSARVERGVGAEETEALRAMLEQRLDTMAQSVNQIVGGVREELAERLDSAVDNGAFEDALTDVNRRLAAAERRQAQTIEAISLEIKRMSESVDKRLRAVEARNDDAAAAAVREELTRMASTLEARFDDIERREAAGFDRVGIEVGRLSERLEERVGAVEARSAQAIEHVGEQVARMAERFSQRHETLTRELSERMVDSEERSSSRVNDAISSIMQRLAEAEERSAEAIAPVQKAVTSVASKLQQYESAHAPLEPEPAMTIPTPARRLGDFESFGSDFGDVDGDVDTAPLAPSPMQAAQPMRAAPLPPQQETPSDDDDLYASDDVDDLLIEDEAKHEEDRESPRQESSPPRTIDDDLLVDDLAEAETEAVAPPPQDDEPFWLPEESMTALQQDEAVAPSDSDVPLGENIFSTSDVPLAETPMADTPPSRVDYLAAARKAAQAQSLPRTRVEPGPTPMLSLRGSSRIILWGAASAIALGLAGGAWYVSHRPTTAPSTAPQPQAQPETQPRSAETAAPAPSEAPSDGGAVDPAVPLAQAPATSQPANAVVAGPLAPRGATLQQAAQAGDLTAQYELALQMISGGQTQEGVTMLRRAADRGFPMAQYRLAKLYERGEGVPVDLVVARQWTERAAAAGNRRAMHDLGVYFARGEGAPLDEAAAFRWFRQAAELGVADSQYNLGVLYQQGRGVNASAPEALFWFLVAARQGDQDAAARATALEAQLSPMQAQQARARAQSFRPRAAIAAANGEFGPRPWARSGA
ncbi:MAG: SEL1-like repeat protein [Hyphomonadaceae bacterium]|nr:SEL1-like repeat protein [Hyphomonadaceae bacterium]